MVILEVVVGDAPGTKDGDDTGRIDSIVLDMIMACRTDVMSKITYEGELFSECESSTHHKHLKSRFNCSRFLLHIQLLYGLFGPSLRKGQWEILGILHESGLAGAFGYA